MKTKIIQTLNDIEKSQNVKILYACEAGSRTWGFSNDESDYDVRFIYIHNDLSYYLSLKEPHDVIQYIDEDLDIVGWDIKKALNLHYKNNPNLREWICSKTIYIDRGCDVLFSDLGGFDKRVLKNHYYSFALNHWKKYSGLEFTPQKTKKYLYIIRSILCWNILNHDKCPPINIHELLSHEFSDIPDGTKCAINDLIRYHQHEGDITEKTLFELNSFILKSLGSMKKEHVDFKKDYELYDEKFKEFLMIR